MKLNPRELEILRILHSSDKALTSTQIVKSGEANGLTQSTAQVVLRKLIAAELIEVRGITHSGNVLSRTFGVTEKSKEVLTKRFLESFGNYRSIISLRDAVEGMLNVEEDADIRAERIKQIESVLYEIKAKKN